MAHWKRRILLGLGIVAVGAVCFWYATEDEVQLFALDSQTGRVQWAVPQQRRGHHTPHVVGDRVVVSQSNYKPPAPFEEPGAPLGRDCRQQGWTLTAYQIDSGRQQWQFCPNAQQYPALDLRLTHGMQLYLSRDRVFVPLVMFRFSPNSTTLDQLLTLKTTDGAPDWSINQNFYQSLGEERSPYLSNGQPKVSISKVSTELYGSSVVSAGDRAVVLTGKLNAPATLQAFTVATGQPLWTRTLSDRLSAQNVSNTIVRNYLLANGRQIFHISPAEAVTAIDGQTGTVQFRLAGRFWGRTRVTDTAIYQFGPTAIAAYNVTTGQRLWQQAIAIPETMETDVLLGTTDEQTVYAHLYQFPKNAQKGQIHILALEAKNGQERWRKQFEHPGAVEIVTRPVTSSTGVTVVVGNTTTADPVDLQLVTLDARNGETRWRFPLRIVQQEHAVARIYGLMSSDPKRVFIRDFGPRFRHWLARLNPNWH